MKNKLASFLIALFGITLAAVSAQAETVIEITANDQMRFDKAAIEVPAGEEIKLVFKNIGSLPKAAWQRWVQQPPNTFPKTTRTKVASSLTPSF